MILPETLVDELPDLVPTEGRPRPAVRAATWAATVLGPLTLWSVGFWLFGLTQPDEARGTEHWFTARQEVWFVGVVYGVVAVPAATLVGAVATALTAPRNRAVAAATVLVVDGCALALLAGMVVGARPG